MTNAASRSLAGRLRHLLTTVDEVSDGQLLQRFVVHHDESAFAKLLERHGGMVLEVARRVLRQRQDAEDVFQATFLLLVRKASSLHRPDSVASWLYGVARRLALKVRDREARRRRREAQAAELGAPRPLVQEAWHELRDLLATTLHQLPDTYRSVLLLCYLEGLTQEEAARRLGCPLGTVRSRLARGREMLRDRLTRHGLVFSATAFATVLATNAARALPSTELLRITCTAAVKLAAGHSVVGLVSAGVAELLRESVRTAILIRGGIAAVVLAAVLFAGLSLFGFLGVGPRQPNAAREADPATEKRPAAPVDVLGDPLPAGAVARLGTIRLRHGDWLSRAVFSPDGKAIASSGHDRTVRLWDAGTGQQLRQLEATPEGNLSVAFSPDGKTLAAGGNDGRIRLWDTSTWEEIHHVKGERSRVWAVEFSPDGKTLATADARIRLWDVATGKKLLEFEQQGTEVTALAISPDGKTLASGSWDDKSVRLWDLATGKELLRHVGHLAQVFAVAFSPDGRLVASGGPQDPELHVWESATGKEVSRFKGEFGFHSAAFSPDGKMLAGGGQNGVLRLWDTTTGEELRKCEGSGEARSLSFAPDGKKLAVAADRKVWLWDVATGKETGPAVGHQEMIWSAALAPDGKTAATADFRTIRLWDLAASRERCRCQDHPGRGDCIVFSPDSQTLASNCWDEKLRLWDAATGKELRQYGGQLGLVNEVAFRPDGQRLASVGQDGRLRLWDVATAKEVRVIKAGDGLKSVAYSPNGKMLATGSWNKVIRLWDADTGQELRTIQGQLGSIWSLAFAADGKTLASVSCGNKYIVSNGRDDQVRLWDVATGQERLHFGGSRGGYYQVRFTPDGRGLVTAGEDGQVRLWDSVTGQERKRFGGHTGPVAAVALSADGRLILSGSSDSTALLWDVTGLRPGGPLHGKLAAADELEGLWKDLAGADAAAAHRAIWQLAGSPQPAVPFLRERLRPAEAVPAERLTRLIGNLDSDEFDVREKATQELEMFADLAEAALRRTAETSTSAEVRKRAERLLEKLDDRSPERLRTQRGIEVLEDAGTEDARKLLRALADGADTARQTRAAKAALDRLAR